MANSFIEQYRALNPTDTRSDSELTLLIGQKYPNYFDQYPDFKTDYDSLIQARTARETPTLGEKAIVQPVGELVRGFANTVASFPEAIATGAQAIERAGADRGIPGMSMERATGPIEQGYATGWLGQKIRQAGEALSPAPVKGLENSLWSSQVPQGVGSTAAFAAGGLAARLFGAGEAALTAIGDSAASRATKIAIEKGLAPDMVEAIGQKASQNAIQKALVRQETASVAGLGAATQASDQYKDAIAHGATSGQAIKAWIGGAVTGTSEAAPLGHMFSKLEKLSNHSFMKAITEGIAQSAEEAIQEGFQSAAGDEIAKKWAGYDPNRNMFQEVAGNATVGGVSGFLVTMLAHAVHSRIPMIAHNAATAEATDELLKDRVKTSIDRSNYTGPKPSDTKLDSTIELAKKDLNNDLTVSEEETIKHFTPDNRNMYALVKSNISRPLTDQEQADLDQRIKAAQEQKIAELQGRLKKDLEEMDQREADRRAEIQKREDQQIADARKRKDRFDQLRNKVNQDLSQEQAAQAASPAVQPTTTEVPNAENQINEAGQVPAIQGQPANVPAAGQTQTGVAQREGQNQEAQVTPPATSPQSQPQPAAATPAAPETAATTTEGGVKNGQTQNEEGQGQELLTPATPPAAATEAAAGKPVDQMTPEELRADRKRIEGKLLEASLDHEDLNKAFEQAGYVLIDGFWVHPHVDPDFVRALKPETKARLKEGGIKFIDPETEVSARAVSMVGGGNKPIRGIGIRTDRSIGSDAFTLKDQHVLHELGHHIWQEELTQEQKDAFAKGGIRTEHGRNVANEETRRASYKGREGVYGRGTLADMVAEEDFAQHFAENGGDLAKTLAPPEAVPAAGVVSQSQLPSKADLQSKIDMANYRLSKGKLTDARRFQLEGIVAENQKKLDNGQFREAQQQQAIQPVVQPVEQPAPQPVAEKQPRQMDETGRPTDKKPINAGDTFLTSSGRETTPYPKYSRKKPTNADLRKADRWLVDNAVAEAGARGDTYNQTIFSNEPARKLPQASKDSMTAYLFGEQPKMEQPVTKPVAEQPKETKTPEEQATEAKLADIRARRAELFSKLREKLKQSSIGIDPETAVIASQLALNYAEEGVVRFVDFARAVKTDMGDVWDQMKQYLRGAWATAADSNPALDDITQKEARVIIEQVDKEPAAEEPAANAEQPTESASSGGQPAGDQSGGAGESGAIGAAGTTDQTTGEVVQPGVRGPNVGTGQSGQTGRGNGGGESDALVDGRPAAPGESEAIDAGAGEGGKPASGGILGRAPGPNRPNIVLAENPAPTTAKGRIKANIRAIEIVRELEKTGAEPTPEQVKELAAWSGWGSFKELFNSTRAQRRDYDLNWVKNYGKYYDQLQKLLSQEEMDAAAESSVNAHYTSQEVVDSMWAIAERLGFKGGRGLDPSTGSGVYVGYAPESVRKNTSWTMVEMEPITAKIASYLYPNEIVKNNPFERTKIPNAHFDIAITNVPFHQTGPGAEYPSLNLHNYFIARMLDKVKPGGLVMVVTSDSTMQNNPEQRDLLASKGQLIGAIRLPNNAFKGSAASEVVTDIMVFRKPDGKPFDSKRWSNTLNIAKEGQTPIFVNEYFVANPDMVLGKHSLTGTMYRDRSYTVESTGPIGPKLTEAIKAFPENIIGNTKNQNEETATELEDGFLTHDKKTGDILEARGFKLKKPNWNTESKTLHDRAVRYVALRDVLRKQYELENDPEASDEEIEKNRKKLRVAYENLTSKVTQLNKLKGGQYALSHLQTDPFFQTVMGLENLVEQQDPNDPTETVPVAKPADVLTTRVLFPDTAPTKAEGAVEALGVSTAYRGKLDLEYIKELTGMDEQQIADELFAANLAFRDPATGILETSQDYLSGDVREKLARAMFAVKEDPSYERNVNALQQVIPPTVPFPKIKYTVGTRWIPTSVLNKFAVDVMGLDPDSIQYNEKAEEFRVVQGRVQGKAKTEWSIDARNAYQLLEHAITLQKVNITVTVRDGNKTTVVHDTAAEAAAEEIIKKIKNQFEAWSRTTDATVEHRAFDTNTGTYKTEQRTIGDVLESEFNRTKNSFIKPDYDGSKLKLPGLTQAVKRTNHLVNGVMRAIQAGRAVFAHGVGSGKTFLLVTASHELKRIGLAKKPVIVVKKPTIGQYRASIEKAYPGSKVLIPTDVDFKQENRKRLISRIASSNWDFIVLSHEQFKSIRPSEESLMSFFEDQIQQLRAILNEMGAANAEEAKSTRGMDTAVRNVVRKIKGLKKRQSDTMESLKKAHDVGLYWHDMGVDALFVDESHNFKNMPIVTQLDNIKGIPSSFSQRAIDMLVKVRDVQSRTQDGRGVFFASGTPVSNTMAELWLMFHATNPKLLEEYGIKTFDSFASTFAEVETNFELGWDMKFRDVTRMSKFTNGSALSLMNQVGMDVKIGNKELGLDVPDMVGDQPAVKTIKPSQGFQRWISLIQEIGSQWASSSKKERFENSWVPIATMRAGVAAALDPRCVFIDAKDEPDSKVNTAVRDIFKEWENGKDRRTTMMVFADLYRTMNTEKLMNWLGSSTAAPTVDDVIDDQKDSENEDTTAGDEDAYAAHAVGDFNLYDDIRKKLVALGVPESDIAVITEHDTDAKREKLFNKVRTGAVRILIGSTEKIGEGVDVPQRMSAQFHLDPPMQMTAAKLEQRIGRIIRQGNLHSPKNWNLPVRVSLYAQERSMDASIYQMLLTKNKMTIQALKGQTLGDEFEDPAGELTYAMAQLIAEATGDRRALDLAQLQKEVRELSLAESAHYRRQSELKSNETNLRRKADHLRDQAAKHQQVSEAAAAEVSKGDSLTLTHIIKGTNYVGPEAIETFLKKVDSAMRDVIAEQKEGTVHTEVNFAFGGLNVELQAIRYRYDGSIKFYAYWSTKKNPNQGVNQWSSDLSAATGLLSAIKRIPDAGVKKAEGELNEAANSVKEADQFKDQRAKEGVFAQAQELAEKQARMRALQDVLEGKKDAETVTVSATGQMQPAAERDMIRRQLSELEQETARKMDDRYTTLDKEEDIQAEHDNREKELVDRLAEIERQMLEWQKSNQHRFSRIGTTQGPSSHKIKQAFSRVLGALAQDGSKIAVLNKGITDVANEAFASIGGAYDADRDVVTLLMNDVHNPTPENLLVALEETAHRFFATEPEYIQKAIVKSVKTVTDQALGLRNVLEDPTINPDSMLEADRLAEERFVKAVSESIDPTEARTLVRRFLDFIKRMYLRVALELQSIASGIGVGQLNPQIAREYAALRLKSMVDGSPMRGLFSLTGRQPHPWEMAPVFQTVYGESYFPTKFSHELQAYTWEPAVADSIEAMLMNHANIRFAHSYYSNRVGNTVSPDLTADQGKIDVVSNNLFKETLGKIYAAFDNSGLNRTATGQPLFQNERALSEYLMARSRQNHPDVNIQAKRQAMQMIGQDINPGLTINDVSGPTKNLATSSAKIMAERLAAHMSRRSTRLAAAAEEKGRRLDRVRDRLARLLLNWRSADVVVAEIRDTINESLRSLFSGLTLINRTGKAMGRMAEMIGAIEGRIDRPIAQQYATLINRVFRRLRTDAEFSRNLFDTVQFLAEDERLDWASMPATEVRDTIRAMASASKVPTLLKGLHGDTAESKAMTTIIGSFLHTNATAVELLKLRKQRMEEGEAKDLEEAFKTLIRGGRQNLRQLSTEINRYGRGQRALARAIERVAVMEKERDGLRDFLVQAEQFNSVNNAVSRTLQGELDRLGGAIGSTANIAGPNQQFDAVPGSRFRVPRNENASVPADFDTATFNQSSEGEPTRSVMENARKIEKWLDSMAPEDPRIGGSMYLEMARTAQVIREFTTFREFRTRIADEKLKILASMSDNLRNIDLPESKAPARRMTRFVEMHTTYLPQIELASHRWVNAEHDAMKALGMEKRRLSKEYFYELFHDRPLNYIASRTDIRDGYANPEDAEGRAVQEALRMLRKDPVSREMMHGENVDRALINFWLVSRDASKMIADIAKKEDVKIPDEADPGYLRDVIGAPLFEVRRMPSAKLKLLYSAMKAAHWAELFPGKADVRTMYEADPNELRAAMQPLFTPFIWNNFLGEFANDPAKSVFLSPNGVTASSVDNVARAFAETTDPVSFAEQLFQLEGGNNENLGSFVSETLTAMHDYFRIFARLQPQTSDDVMGNLSDGAASVLMGGRLMNDLPPGLVQNRRYNSVTMHSMLNGVAYTAAFGHRNAAIRTEFQQLTRALENERNIYKAIENDAHRNTLGKGKRALRAEMVRLAGSEERMKRLEGAYQATEMAARAEASFDQFVNHHAGGIHYNFQTGQELISMVSVGAIQGIKTMLTDTSSTIKPAQMFGVSRQSFKMSAGALLSEIPRSAIQSVANVFGVDLHVVSDEMKRMGLLGIVDPDYEVRFKDKIRNNMESIEALPTRKNIIQRGLLNVAKGVKAVFDTPLKIGREVKPELQAVPAFRPIGPYNTFSRVSQYSVALSMIREYQNMVAKAVQWYDLNGGKNNEAFYDIHHRFNPEDLGYRNGRWLKDADTFRQMEEYLTHAGATINSLAVDYLRRAGNEESRDTGVPLITDQMFGRLLTLSSTYLTQEKSILTQPEGTMRNPGTQVILPLLSWGLRQTYSLAPTFRDANGRRAFWRGINSIAILATAGIAWSLLQDWYDDEILGKQSNILPLTLDDKKMLAISIVDRLARVGTLGFVGEGVNYFVNQSTARPFSLDGRLLFANTIKSFSSAWSDFYHQDWTGTYATVWKPMLSSIGGTGWQQNIQAINHLFGEVAPSEARINARINVNNYLRVAGRQTGMDVRTGFGSQAVSTPIRPWVTEMVLSAIANDHTAFNAAYEKAIQSVMKFKGMNRAAAEKSVAQSYRAYHPLQAVFRTSPTREDYLRLLGALDDQGRQDVMEAVRLVDAYGAQIGASPGIRQENEARQANISRNPFRSSRAAFGGQSAFGRSPFAR